MKTIIILLASISFGSFSLSAQNETHTTISSYSLSTIAAEVSSVPQGSQSALIATYFVILKDTSNIAKIWVRVSSAQQPNGGLLNQAYAFNSPSVTDNQGIVLYMRSKNIVYIRTIIPNGQTGNTYEVCTENNSGQKSAYLNRVR